VIGAQFVVASTSGVVTIHKILFLLPSLPPSLLLSLSSLKWRDESTGRVQHLVLYLQSSTHCSPVHFATRSRRTSMPSSTSTSWKSAMSVSPGVPTQGEVEEADDSAAAPPPVAATSSSSPSAGGGLPW